MSEDGVVLGIIPARGGSVRVPRKNIKPLGGKPLIAYTIEAAKNAKLLDYFLVSTNDLEMAKISKDYGAPVPFKRPEAISTDCDSIPGYSPILIRQRGSGAIDILPFDELWDSTIGIIREEEHRTVKILDDRFSPFDVFIGHVSKQGSVFTPIKSISRHHYKGLLTRVNSTCGLIDATPNHSLIDSKGNVIDASKVKIGDTLSIPKLNVKGYPENDTFVGSRDLAWLLGLFTAEGCTSLTTEKTSTSYIVKVSNKNLQRLNKAAKILRKYFRGKTWVTTDKDESCSHLYMSNKNAYDYFSCCYTKTWEKRIPRFVLNSDKKVKLSFLDGYNEGDGITKPQRKWHSGRFKVFGSISQTLCLGLLLLISQTTKQDYSIDCREDKPNFTRIVLNEGIRKRREPPQEVKRVQEINYEGFVYDIETKYHQFCTGVGTIRAHNSVLVLQHAVKRYEAKKGKKVSHVVCLQTTSPFRTPEDIDECIRIAKATGVDSVVSFVKVAQHPYWCFEQKSCSHEMQPFLPEISLAGENLVSQNLPLLFYPNGAVYVVKREVVMAGKIFGERIYGYTMPEERSIDLETEKDFLVAEVLLPLLKSKEPLVKISWALP